MSNLIAIDWGTSSFRIYLLDNTGKILQSSSSEDGILSVSENKFEQTLSKHLKKLTVSDQNTPIIASGMITSKKGWCETPYATCPANIEDLAQHLVPLETTQHGIIWFVPGVKQLSPHPDIMRGEETQLAGINKAGEFTTIMPGTHSKWVKMSDQCIKAFTTFMTGELFAVIMNHSILGTANSDSWDDNAFRKGVALGYRTCDKGTTLLSDLFQVRAQAILEIEKEEKTKSLVSGILIGHEIFGATQTGFVDQNNIYIIGEELISKFYALALEECGITSEIVTEIASVRGLFRIAQQKQLI